MSRSRLWYCKNWIDFYTLFYVETHKIIEESRASLELKGSAGNAAKFFVLCFCSRLCKRVHFHTC